jgi:hypothetical protein
MTELKLTLYFEEIINEKNEKILLLNKEEPFKKKKKNLFNT